uniref:Uncharacterized protein n=1 Tax=Panagrolaimus sp. ES5 TaxID=591445 RepID=A0AC34FNA9_9BILA
MKYFILFSSLCFVLIIQSTWQAPMPLKPGNNESSVFSAGHQKFKRDFWSKLRDKVTDKLIDNIGKRNVVPSDNIAAADILHKKLHAIDKLKKPFSIDDNGAIKKQKRDFWSDLRDNTLTGG